MVVISIIAVLTVAGIVSYINAGISSRDAKRQADMEQVKAALVLYRTDHGAYPIFAATGSGVGYTNYSSMFTSLQTGSYLSSAIDDPKNPTNSYAVNGTYGYRYLSSADGKTFSLWCFLEKGGGTTQYTVTNP